MATILVREGQTMLDLCLQANGSISTVFDAAGLNGLAITDLPEIDATLLMPDQLIDRRAVAVLGRKPNYPVSNDDRITVPGGIGYMQIGNDFIVS